MKNENSIQRVVYEADLTALYVVDDEPEISKAFASIFGVLPKSFGSGLAVPAQHIMGIGDDGIDEGVYFQKENGHMVYVMNSASKQMTDVLGVEAGVSFIVYTDSYKEEGPFIGKVDPVNKVQTFKNWSEAKAEFIAQIHAK